MERYSYILHVKYEFVDNESLLLMLIWMFMTLKMYYPICAWQRFQMFSVVAHACPTAKTETITSHSAATQIFWH